MDAFVKRMGEIAQKSMAGKRVFALGRRGGSGKRKSLSGAGGSGARLGGYVNLGEAGDRVENFSLLIGGAKDEPEREKRLFSILN